MLYKNGLKLLRYWFWLFITWKNEQKIFFWHFAICPGQEIHIFLVVCEPYRALESVQGVRFQGKNCFTKMASKLLLNWFWLFITWKVNKKYYYDILVSAWVNVKLMGESTRLVCVQLQERDFEKKNLYQKWWRFPTNTMQKNFDNILVFLRFPLRDGFLHFCLGFDFGSDICVSKFGICLLCKIRFLLKSCEQLLFSFYYAHCTGCITPCFWIPTINQYLQFQGTIAYLYCHSLIQCLQ